jgi:putative CRISPR-associated protein (TIGR02619 family)
MGAVLITVGTSLLTNRDSGIEKPRPWCGWKAGDKLPEKSVVLEYLHSANLSKASAETNTLRALEEKGLLDSSDVLHWLYSDTSESEFCAFCLMEFYRSVGLQGELHKISGLTYEAGSFAEKGLRSLVDKTFEVINRAHRGGLSVKICATGGFKAEASFFTLVGLLTQSPVYYIHELFHELVELPCLPVNWDMSVVERSRDFLEWIDEEPRLIRDVEQRLYNYPEMRSLVHFDKDGFAYLSAAGEALYKAYKSFVHMPVAEWPPNSPKSPDEKVNLSNIPHHRPPEVEKYIDILKCIGYVSLISYGGEFGASGTKISVKDPDTGVLRVVVGGERSFELIVETTAHGKAQSELVADDLKRKLAR